MEEEPDPPMKHQFSKALYFFNTVKFIYLYINQSAYIYFIEIVMVEIVSVYSFFTRPMHTNKSYRGQNGVYLMPKI